MTRPFSCSEVIAEFRDRDKSQPSKEEKRCFGAASVSVAQLLVTLMAVCQGVFSDSSYSGPIIEAAFSSPTEKEEEEELRGK